MIDRCPCCGRKKPTESHRCASCRRKLSEAIRAGKARQRASAPDADEPSEAELDAIIAVQRANLPEWWERENGR